MQSILRTLPTEPDIEPAPDSSLRLGEDESSWPDVTKGELPWSGVGQTEPPPDSASVCRLRVALTTPARRTAAVVDRVLSELRRLCRTATLEFSIKVGKLIIDEFYDGDLAAWRKRGAKDHAFRALASRPELPMSRGGLYRAVALYEVCQRFGNGAHWRHLSSSHVRLVLGLNDEDQTRLLAAAETERLTVNQLEEEVTKVRASVSTSIVRGGRRRLPELIRTVRAIKKCIDAKGRLAGSGHDPTRLDPQLVEEITATLRLLRAACDELLSRLDQTENRSQG